MTGAGTSMLETLRGSIKRIEAHGDADMSDRVGHVDVDAAQQGGLVMGCAVVDERSGRTRS